MPQRTWNRKRERQYEHIESGPVRRGTAEGTAEKIAARTVNRSEHASASRRRRAEPRSTTCRPRHSDTIGEYVDAGFDEVYLAQVGQISRA